MSIVRLALGLAAATAAAVMYANSRKKSGGSYGTDRDESSSGMGSTPGTDRWSSGSSGMGSPGMGSSMDSGNLGSTDLRGSSGMGPAGQAMTGGDNDDLLSPATTESDLGGSSSSGTPGRSGGL